MKILVIGGTQFIGRYLSIELIKSGHNIVLFHKNKVNRSEESEFQHIIGDRRRPPEGKLTGKFDLVIDTCAFEPSDLDFLAHLDFEKYLFISTVAVYSPDIPEGQAEDAHRIDGVELNVEPHGYGILKRYTEDLVFKLFPSPIVIRPSVVLGPGDNSRRLNRIYEEFVRGNTLHAPVSDDNSLITQFIDVRDLVNLIVEIISRDMSGSFNLVGKTVKWNDFLSAFTSVVGIELNAAESISFPLWDTTKSRGLRTLQSSHEFIRNFDFTELEDSLKDWFYEYQRAL
ncbi:RNA-binding protein [Candidatus Nanopelagicaceae bacterium]